MSDGYKNLGFKVKDCASELIDNSFDQGATELNLWFFEEEYEGVSRVSFLFQDNGPGVPSDMINEFISVGDSSVLTKQDISKNGKFHWGLASSLGALSNYAEIYSNIGDGVWYNSRYPYLDRDSTETDIKDPFSVVSIREKLMPSESGLIFYIQRISRVILSEVNDLEQLISLLTSYIGETYREDLAHATIRLNGDPIRLVDPLMRNKSSMWYDVIGPSFLMGKIDITFEDIKLVLDKHDGHLVNDFRTRHLANNINLTKPIIELIMVRLEQLDKPINNSLPN